LGDPRPLHRQSGPIRLVCVDHLATQECGRGLYRALAESGEVELTLVIPPRWRDNFRDIPADPPSGRFATEILPLWFPGKSNRCLHWGLGRLFRNLRPDVVFVQAEPEDFLLSQILLLRAIYRLDFKVVFITWRNIPYPRLGIPYKFSWVYGCTEFLGLRYGDHCFSFIESGRQTLGTRGFRALDVMPPAIDTAFFHPTDNTQVRSDLGLNAFTVGYFGRFVEEKGVGLLLEAVAGMDRTAQVLLVDGPARASWFARARRLGIVDHLVHKPSVLRSEMPALLCACDSVVLPSYATPTWREQFGRVLVEAMACGIPVVGSDSGEIPAVIGEAGLVFPEKNVAGLRGALRRMAEEPGLRERLAALGRTRAEREYSCPAVAGRWINALRRLASAQEMLCDGRAKSEPIVESHFGHF
jgi:glycosyltransferase involved in cell wall biosynthesis